MRLDKWSGTTFLPKNCDGILNRTGKIVLHDIGFNIPSILCRLLILLAVCLKNMINSF
jgi:hypothetical protein